MTIASVVCRGYGPDASIAFVSTRGYSINDTPPAPAIPLGNLGPSGAGRRRRRARADTPEFWREIDRDRIELRQAIEAVGGADVDLPGDSRADQVLDDKRAPGPAHVAGFRDAGVDLSGARAILAALTEAIEVHAVAQAAEAARQAELIAAELTRLARQAEAEDDDGIALMLIAG